MSVSFLRRLVLSRDKCSGTCNSCVQSQTPELIAFGCNVQACKQQTPRPLHCIDALCLAQRLPSLSLSLSLSVSLCALTHTRVYRRNIHGDCFGEHTINRIVQGVLNTKITICIYPSIAYNCIKD